jgi:hypothetical protein
MPSTVATFLHATEATNRVFRSSFMHVNVRLNICEIWGSHGGENADCGLLSFDTVWTCRWITNVSRDILPPPSNRKHGITTQKINIDFWRLSGKFRSVGLPYKMQYRISKWPFSWKSNWEGFWRKPVPPFAEQSRKLTSNPASRILHEMSRKFPFS